MLGRRVPRSFRERLGSEAKLPPSRWQRLTFSCDIADRAMSPETWGESSASPRRSTSEIASEREVAVPDAGGDDPAIALEGHAAGDVSAPEVCPPLAISREARVESRGTQSPLLQCAKSSGAAVPATGFEG